jgi:hypothetical protein
LIGDAQSSAITARPPPGVLSRLDHDDCYRVDTNHNISVRCAGHEGV